MSTPKMCSALGAWLVFMMSQFAFGSAPKPANSCGNAAISSMSATMEPEIRKRGLSQIGPRLIFLAALRGAKPGAGAEPGSSGRPGP